MQSVQGIVPGIGVAPGDVLKINGIETFINNYTHYIVFGPLNAHGLNENGKMFGADRWDYLGKHEADHWFVFLTDLTLTHDGKESVTCTIGSFWERDDHYMVSGDDETDTPFAILPKADWELTHYNSNNKSCNFAHSVYVILRHKLKTQGVDDAKNA